MNQLNTDYTIKFAITNNLGIAKKLIVEPWGVQFDINLNDKIVFIGKTQSNDSEITVEYLEEQTETTMIVFLDAVNVSIWINDTLQF